MKRKPAISKNNNERKKKIKEEERRRRPSQCVVCNIMCSNGVI
jgi:hypothetical protein